MAEITMPKLSDTMTEGVLVSWKKKAGETVSSGEVIAEVETDKATMEMEAFEDGVLSDLVPEGSKIAVGERIAVIGGASGTPAATPAKRDPGKRDKTPVPVPAETPAETQLVGTGRFTRHGERPRASAAHGSTANGNGNAAAVTSNGERVKASPLARKGRRRAGRLADHLGSRARDALRWSGDLEVHDEKRLRVAIRSVDPSTRSLQAGERASPDCTGSREGRGPARPLTFSERWPFHRPGGPRPQPLTARARPAGRGRQQAG